MSDDAFNEVQLSGKQLAFLFMAWAAVSVVVFLLGVMVGRGVRDASGGSTAPVVDTAQAQPADTGAASSAAPPPTKPSASNDDYYKMLTGDTGKPVDPPVAAAEAPPTKDGAAAPAAGRSAAPAPPVPSAAKATVDSKAGGTAVGTPPASPAATAGYIVHISSLNDQSAAEKIVAKLKAAGFDAALLVLPVGQPVRFRVRMGPFAQRADADRVKTELEKAGYKPYVTKG